MKKTKIIERPFKTSDLQLAQQLGLSDLQAKLVATRIYDTTESSPLSLNALEKIVFPKLKHIQHPNELKNSQLAAQLIADAIQGQGKIVLATDYDTDGVTSAWVATQALTKTFKVPKERIVYMIGERKNGYGINDTTCDRILDLAKETLVDIVISADQGSSDEPRIKRLSQAGIKVCITDHHQMATEGAPKSAACTVNPQQEGCEYDKTVAGCYVIFLVMGQVRAELIKRGVLPADTPSLKDLALNVALGTVADSVSLKSPNNRAIVSAGLALINQFKNPAWQAVKQANLEAGQQIDTEFLGFQVATRINAASRVSDVKTAFKFLNASSVQKAQAYLQQLDQDNIERRAQQQSMLEQAQNQAAFLYHPKKYSLAIKLKGNAGIQGIIASRIGEQYGVPTLAMTDLEDGTLAGSGRGIVANIDLRTAFQWMSEQDVDLFISMGGHAGAAGCMIPIEKYERFSSLLEQAIKQQLGDEIPTPTIFTDGPLEDAMLNLHTLQDLKQLEPYGREWPQPTFSGRFIIQTVRVVGQTQTHYSFRLISEHDLRLSAIYFNAKQSAEEETPFYDGQLVEAAYQLSENQYMGRSSLQLRILAMNPVN